MTDQPSTNTLHTFLDADVDPSTRNVDDSASDVGTRIAEARTAAGRTQNDLANQLGVKVSTLDKWELGAASPRSNRLPALAGILGVSLSWLIVGYGDEPTASAVGDVDIDLDDVRSALSRVRAQLTDALHEVDALTARLDAAPATD